MDTDFPTEQQIAARIGVNHCGMGLSQILHSVIEGYYDSIADKPGLLARVTDEVGLVMRDLLANFLLDFVSEFADESERKQASEAILAFVKTIDWGQDCDCEPHYTCEPGACADKSATPIPPAFDKAFDKLA